MGILPSWLYVSTLSPPPPGLNPTSEREIKHVQNWRVEMVDRRSKTVGLEEGGVVCERGVMRSGSIEMMGTPRVLQSG